MRIGLDMLDIERMERLLHHARFMERIYSAAEREYIASKGSRAAQTAAGIFCAKEAYAKAAGRGVAALLGGCLEVRYDQDGKPFMQGAAVSITHTDRTAAAVVLLED